MDDLTKLALVLEAPEALRGLDQLMERVRRVLERYAHVPLRMPLRTPDQSRLARTA